MFADFESKIWEFVSRLSPSVHGILWQRRRIFKYLFSGGTAAFVNIFFLYLFTDIFHIWYVISAGLAFLIAFIVSFIFQKFWTFEDHSTDGVHAQVALYLTVALVNLFINTLLIYVFVEYLLFYYLIAQIVASILIACVSFFIYKKFVFRGARL